MAVDWSAIAQRLDALAELKAEKAKIEDCLRDAGLADLIR